MLAATAVFLRMHRLILVLIAVLYGLDQVSKFIVSQSLDLGQSVPAEGFFRVTYSYNTGSAFGFFQGQNTPLILASFVGIIILTWIYRTHPQPGLLLHASLGLQVAGAMGNLTDRIARGRVVDFFDVGPWPIFNVADSSIVVGVVLLAWVITTGVGRHEPAVDDEEFSVLHTSSPGPPDPEASDDDRPS